MKSFLTILNIFITYELYASFNYESLANFLSDKKISKIEELLETISTSNDSSKKELLKNYVLMYNSRSLQEGTFHNPRSILFSRDASFVMSFNGHSNQAGYDELEIMEYNKNSQKFTFYSVNFAGPTPVFSQKNPSLCLNCHQQDPRPNWEIYFLWPGSYGSEDDDIFRAKELNLVSKFEPTIEYQRYQEFLNIKKSHNRYKYLIEIPEIPLEQFDGSNRPNHRFTFLLQQRNAERIARKISKSKKNISDLRYAILGTALCNGSDSVKDFLPSNLSSQIINSLEDQYFLNLSRLEHLNRNKNLELHKLILNDAPYGRVSNSGYEKDFLLNNASIESNNRMEYLMLLFGINTSDWGMNLTPGISHIQNGLNIKNFIDTILHYLFTRSESITIKRNLDEENRNLGYGPVDEQVILYQPKTGFCDNLKALSINSLKNSELLFYPQNLNGVHLLQKDISNEKIFNLEGKKIAERCMRCHQQKNNKIIPYIAFDDLNKLKSQLNESDYLYFQILFRTNQNTPKQYKMPLGLPELKEQEREHLLEYLNQVRTSN